MAGIKLPVYERQVGPGAIPGYRQQISISPTGFGAGIGQGIKELGGVVAQIAQKEMDKQDTAVLTDAHAKLGMERLKIERDFKKLQGRDALEGSKQARDDFTIAAERVMAAIPRERQRARFKELLSREELGFTAAVDTHASRQGEVLFIQSNAASKAIADQAGIEAVGLDGVIMDQAIELAKKTKMDAVDAGADHAGADDKIRKVLTMEATNTFHAGVLDAMLNAPKIDAARGYLEKNKDEIDSRVVGKVKSRIDSLVSEGMGRRIADEIIDKVTKGRDLWDMDYATATQMVRKDKSLRSNEKARGTAENIIDDELRRRKSARSNHDEPYLTTIEMQLERGGGFNRSANVYGKLSDIGKLAAEKMWSAKKKEGTKEQNDEDRILRNVLLEIDNNDLRNMTPGEFNTLFSGASVKGMSELRVLAKIKTGKAGVDDGGFAAMVKQKALEKYPNNSPEHKYERSQFESYMKNRRARWDAKNEGNPLTSDVGEWLADELTQEKIKFDEWYKRDREMERWKARVQGHVAPAEITPADKGPLGVSDSDRARIMDRAKARGITELTDDQIRAILAKEAAKKRKK